MPTDENKNGGETDFFRKDRLIDRAGGVRHNDVREREEGQLGIGEGWTGK